MEQKCILASHDGDTNDSVTKNRFNKQNMVLQCAMRIFVHFSPLVCKILLGEPESKWQSFNSYLIFRIECCHYTFSLSKRLDPTGALNRSM